MSPQVLLVTIYRIPLKKMSSIYYGVRFQIASVVDLYGDVLMSILIFFLDSVYSYSDKQVMFDYEANGRLAGPQNLMRW
jgi:hypothetical protein